MALEWGPVSWDKELLHQALDAVILAIKQDANPYFRHAALELASSNSNFVQLSAETLKARIMAEIELYQLLNAAKPRMGHYELESPHYYGALETLIVRAIERPHHSTFTFLQINSQIYLRREYPFCHQVQELVSLLGLPDFTDLPELGELSL